MAPHQYWNVCGLKKTIERGQPKQNSALSLFPRAHIKSQENPSFRLCPSRFRKVARPPSDLLNCTQNKEAHKRNEGPPSFRTRHQMFKTVHQNQQLKRSISLLERNPKLGLTNSLPFRTIFHHFSLSLHFLSPHPSPLLSMPVHGERKALLAVTVDFPSTQSSHSSAREPS